MGRPLGTVVVDEVICPIVSVRIRDHAIIFRCLVPKTARGQRLSGRLSIFGEDGLEWNTIHNWSGFTVPDDHPTLGDVWLDLPMMEASAGHPDLAVNKWAGV